MPIAALSQLAGGAQLGGSYSDIDMEFTADDRYVRKDGTDYAAQRAG